MKNAAKPIPKMHPNGFPKAAIVYAKAISLTGNHYVIIIPIPLAKNGCPRDITVYGIRMIQNVSVLIMMTYLSQKPTVVSNVAT